MKRRTLAGLGRLQSEVMEWLWELEEATVAQVVERISQKRRVTYTTVLAAMQRLEKKGWVTHRRQGRAYAYRALRTRQVAHQGLLQEMIQTVFCGDPRRLVTQLLDEHPLTDAELGELQDLIDQRRGEKTDG